MLQGKTISLVTRFMDRGEHLRHSLPSWLSIPQIDEIIIVDFDSRNDDALEIVRTVQEAKPTELKIPVHVLRVNNQEYFNRGLALNIGCHYAQGEFIFHVDADVILEKNPLPLITLDKYILWRATNRWTSLCGTCIFSKELWQGVGGYAEFQKGWGHDDDYFHGKLYQLGVKVQYMDFTAFKHIDHDDIESSVYHEMKERWRSRDLNMATAALIRKVSFNTIPVEVSFPDGKKRSFNFPLQIIDKKQPVELMEKIYKEKKVPDGFWNDHKPDDTPFKDGPSLVQKSRNAPILSFPRPRRL